MKNQKPLISVIMPVYNASSYVESAINSILNQTYPHLELLICDDASTDNSVLKISTFEDGRIKFFQSKKNQGYLKTCNILFEQCKGNYITFQDADDWSEPNRLELLLNEFDKHPELSLLGSSSRYFHDHSDETFRYRICENDNTELKQIISNSSPFNGATICIRREVYEKIGGYNIFFDRIASEDFDWLCRISENFELGAIREILYHVRVTKTSITRTITQPMQLLSHEIALFCQNQRLIEGSDGLTGGDKKSLDTFIEQKMAPFVLDPSLLYRRLCEQDMYNKFYKKAFINSLKAISIRPNKSINYRTFFYILRKAHIKLLQF